MLNIQKLVADLGDFFIGLHKLSWYIQLALQTEPIHFDTQLRIRSKAFDFTNAG